MMTCMCERSAVLKYNLSYSLTPRHHIAFSDHSRNKKTAVPFFSVHTGPVMVIQVQAAQAAAPTDMADLVNHIYVGEKLKGIRGCDITVSYDQA
eukprot:m.329198 g.329198  ORF g.329198 m.329198 type:complete len:94 (+) comp20442_c0_seq3:349-630(+)